MLLLGFEVLEVDEANASSLFERFINSFRTEFNEFELENSVIFVVVF